MMKRLFQRLFLLMFIFGFFVCGNSSADRALLRAVKWGQINQVKALLAQGADIDTRQKYRWPSLNELMFGPPDMEGGKTPLIFALEKRYPEIVLLLIERNADINASDDDKITPLMYATEMGNFKIIKRLVEGGANVNAVTKEGTTVIMHTIRMIIWIPPRHIGENPNTPNANERLKKYLTIVDYLITKGADVNLVDDVGKSAAMHAVQADEPKILKLLLERGSDMNIRCHFGENIVTLTIQREDYRKATEVLLAHGANINAPNKDGTTALMEAANDEELQKIKYLLTKGADINARDHLGRTALDHAKKTKATKIVKYLKAASRR